MELWEALHRWLLHLKTVPAEDKTWGKECKYTECTIENKRASIAAFSNWLGIEKTTPLDEINEKHFELFHDKVMESKYEPSAKYYFLLQLKEFFKYCREKGWWDGELDFPIPRPTPNRIREIPVIREEKWQAIRAAPRSTKGKAIVALMFNQFRVWEIMNLRWENLPHGFFDKYRGSQMINVVRKGGEKWVCKVDEDCWRKLYNYWAKIGKPSSGYMFGRNGGRPNRQTIVKHFYKARDRVLYRPEDKEVRNKITPHSVRHYAARRFAVLNPVLAVQIGPVLGGWRPWSKTYQQRYLNIRNIFPQIIDNADIKW